MLQKCKYHVCLIVLLALCSSTVAQQPSGPPILPGQAELSGEEPSADNSASFTIREILISGNKRTKENIILREIPFRSGEKYALQDLVRKFEDARRQLMNTALFHTVEVAMHKTEGSVIDGIIINLPVLA